jgi:beta-glucosidase
MKNRLQSFILLSTIVIFIAIPAAQAQQDVENHINSLIQKLTLEEKIDLIGGVDGFYIREMKSIGLPRLKMADGPLGVRNYGPSTTFTAGIALASTWDPELAQRVGSAIGQDARARGVHFMLGPGVNIYRAPMNGRNFEYFGEDPYLASRTAVAYINGMQSEHVSATIKHFVGNNSEFDRHNVDSEIDERTMREIYLPTFEAAVKLAHVGSIMDSYNFTNGEHMTQNSRLNTDIAKKEWGFDGIMMSDWVATYDGVAAANGGLDLEMPSPAFMNRATLLPAVKDGRVTEATIDDKVRRILRLAIRFGWMDHDQTDLSIPRLNPEGAKVALEEARSGMVLLKNEGNLLPLQKEKIKTIAVIGPDAYPAQPVGGGSAGVKPFVASSYLDGIATYVGDATRVYYDAGLPTIQEMAETTHFETEASGGKPGVTVEQFKAADLAGTPEITAARNMSYGSGWQGSYGLAADYRSARWTAY